ncbi:hypothetical protein S40293_10897 [Stachybotrys chartarum IBT 40293]|nr:hypothetical protein S40293_10897 [Stachybotrys chartarum IBT 40293]
MHAACTPRPAWLVLLQQQQQLFRPVCPAWSNGTAPHMGPAASQQRHLVPLCRTWGRNVMENHHEPNRACSGCCAAFASRDNDDPFGRAPSPPLALVTGCWFLSLLVILAQAAVSACWSGKPLVLAVLRSSSVTKGPWLLHSSVLHLARVAATPRSAPWRQAAAMSPAISTKRRPEITHPTWPNPSAPAPSDSMTRVDHRPPHSNIVGRVPVRRHHVGDAVTFPTASWLPRCF